MSFQIARVSGAQAGAFSQERVFIHRLSPDPYAAPAARTVLRPLRRRFFLRSLLPAGILFGAILFHLFIRIEIIHAGYRLNAERERALDLDRQVRELNSKLAEATGPKRLLERAERELGLAVTPPQRTRTIAQE